MASPYSRLKAASCTQQKTPFLSTHGYQYGIDKNASWRLVLQLPWWLAKILEKTCPRSPCKENFSNWKHFLPLVGMYLHKELIIAMKVIIIFKEDFNFAMLIIYYYTHRSIRCHQYWVWLTLFKWQINFFWLVTLYMRQIVHVHSNIFLWSL